jgi:hypothetical protein
LVDILVMSCNHRYMIGRQDYRSLSILIGAVLMTACIAFGLITIFLPAATTAAEMSVQLHVETRDVYQGESFLVQIEVNGSDRAEPPEFPDIDGFSVEYVGGSNNSSQSITIINGKVERVVRKGYVFNYRFTPLKTGRLVIPSIRVEVEGKKFTTSSVTVAVRKPGKSEDFKLRIDLSDSECYTAEPVVMTVTWYLRRNVEDARFTIPVLGNDSFDFVDPQVEIDRGKKYHRIRVGRGEVIAEEGSGMLEGKRYTTLKFSKVLIPRESGTFVIPEAVVECEAITGVGSVRDFFSDNFFSSRGGRLRKYVVSSNSLRLTVRQLPLEGRPPGFSGLVGEFRISASADPVKVNVGDPITLKITMEGADYLGNVELPPLGNQEALTSNFKVPDERAAGKIVDGKKIFTQTIRARSDQVTQIPSLKLVYFDTERERYQVASSKPIPIEVIPTRIVTAGDAEGIKDNQTGTPLEKWKEGIAYNYQGEEIIRPQSYGVFSLFSSRILLLLLVLPPLGYLILLSSTAAVRKHRSRPEIRRARSAFKRFKRRVKSIGREEPHLAYSDFCSRMMEAMRNYLGDRFGRPGSAITGRDVDDILMGREISAGLIADLKNIMDIFEGGSFAGEGSEVRSRKDLIKIATETVRKLEKIL